MDFLFCEFQNVEKLARELDTILKDNIKLQVNSNDLTTIVIYKLTRICKKNIVKFYHRQY